MASRPTPSPPSDVLRPIVRSARGLGRLRVRSVVGELARGAEGFAGELGVATSARVGVAAGEADAQTALPWGVWPRARQPDTAAAVAAGLDPSLAGYAAMLRRRQRPARARAPKVLPLVVRRDGDTARGAGTAPGGLARRSVPLDHPVQPLEARLTRDPLAALRAAAAAAKASPTAGRSPATPAPTARTPTTGAARRHPAPGRSPR